MTLFEAIRKLNSIGIEVRFEKEKDTVNLYDVNNSQQPQQIIADTECIDADSTTEFLVEHYSEFKKDQKRQHKLWPHTKD